MTQKCSYTIAARPHAVRFDISTPKEVIHRVVCDLNEQVTERIGGMIFYPFDHTVELFEGKRVKVIRLRADEAAWRRFVGLEEEVPQPAGRQIACFMKERRSVQGLAASCTAAHC